MGNERGLWAYEPEDAQAYERMRTFMAACETEDDLKAVTLLYLFDMSYPRRDLLMAEAETRREKGWRK